VSFSFHPAARTELNEAVDYYEGCRPGLGWKFAQEVKSAIARILQHPDGWTPVSRRARRCLTARFPYGVIYAIDARHVRILAVAHCHREPGYRHRRLAESTGTEPAANDREEPESSAESGVKD
jgi:plasmid stabilization system protein ParE